MVDVKKVKSSIYLYIIYRFVQCAILIIKEINSIIFLLAFLLITTAFLIQIQNIYCTCRWKVYRRFLVVFFYYV